MSWGVGWGEGPPCGMPESPSECWGGTLAPLTILLPPNTHPGQQQVAVLTSGLLPAMWDTGVEFKALDLGPAHPWLLQGLGQ